MRKNLRKFIAICMICIMAIGMGTVASAAENEASSKEIPVSLEADTVEQQLKAQLALYFLH